MTKIFDAQAHYMPPEVAEKTTFFKVNWSDCEKQLAVMDQFGIERSLLLYPTSDAHLRMGGWKELCCVYNRAIGQAVKDYPDRFIGGGILPPDNERDLREEMGRLDDLNLRVISLASSYDGRYLDDEIFFPVYEFARERNRPIHVHPQIMSPIGEDRVRDPLLTPVLEYVFDVSICIGKLMMGGVFEKFPTVKFIFAHYGGVLPFVKERFDNTYAMLRKRNFVKDIKKAPGEYFQNLYFDTSGSQSPASLLCALEVADASHILFGSDYPANQNLAGSISVIEKSPLSAANKTAILRENLNNLFGKI